MLELYAIDIEESLSNEQYEEWMNKVSADQRKRIDRFRSARDARRTLYGDILIRYLICQNLKLNNDDILIRRNEYGKPFLKGYPVFHYNISHAGKWVICAISRYPVGVDIEQLTPIDLKIAKRYFTKNEYASILNEPVHRRGGTFFRIWTAKESYVKYVGKGLSIPLDSFSISWANRGNQRVDIDTACTIQTLEIMEGYVISICYSIKESDPLFIQRIQLGGIKL